MRRHLLITYLIKLVMIVTFFISMACFVLYLRLPDVEDMGQTGYTTPLRIYTSDGHLIGEFGDKIFMPVSLDEVPDLLKKAFLVTEDQRFYDHNGVDLIGMARATKSLMMTGEKLQGASTITMQVARNFYLSSKKTYQRKLQEVLLAYKIDRQLSKEAILTLYLNKIFLGNKAYGIKAAAKIYYGKELNELDLSEMATIAGLPKAPSRDNPIANPIDAKSRRNFVLSRLKEQEYISWSDYQEAIEKSIHTYRHGPEITVDAPYVAEMVRQEMLSQYGEQTYIDGYRVFTTIHGDMQQRLHERLSEEMLKLPGSFDISVMGHRQYIKRFGLHQAAWIQALAQEKHFSDYIPAVVLDHDPDYQIVLANRQLLWADQMEDLPDHLMKGDVVYLKQLADDRYRFVSIPEIEVASVVLSPDSGEILALVGGFDFNRSQYNRITQAHRQPGSLMKPFIYASALEHGYTLASLVDDSPLVVDGKDAWRPKNAGVRFLGPVRLRWALMSSLNLATIRLVNELGLDHVRPYMTKFGFHLEDMPDYLSLSLGTNTSTPLDLARAYAVFANGGYLVDPYVISRIELESGSIVDERQPSALREVIDEELAFMINDVLRDATVRGSSKQIKSLGRVDLSGKTGSTNEDVWFCGYNRHLVSLLWLGYDDHRPLHYLASHLALPVWKSTFSSMMDLVSEAPQPLPKSMVRIRINDATGAVTDYSDNEGVFEYFKSDSLDVQASQSNVSDEFMVNVFE